MLKKIGLLSIVVVAAVLLSGDSLWGEGEFYVIGGGSPWKRDGNNIYYTAGKVGIGLNSPSFPLHIRSSGDDGVFSENWGNGAGVRGVNTSGTPWSYGVYGGNNSASGIGVSGVNSATTGTGSGVYGRNESASGYGVYGENTQAGGKGIYGISSATTGVGSGVTGITNSNDYRAAGVLGENSVTGSSGAPGVKGINKNNNLNAAAVTGCNLATEGTGVGVTGWCGSPGGWGVFGGGGNTGVRGQGSWAGVHADGYGGTYGLYASGGGGAQYGIYCNGNFAVVNGSKNAIVPTSQGDRKLYSQESPEV